MAERDPRVDPMPGDVVRVSGHQEFTVLDADEKGNNIFGRFGHGMRGSLCGFPWWRRWAATATVIRRAEDGTGRKDAE